MQYIQFLILASSVAAVSFTITMTKVTAPLRVKIMLRSQWFGNLFSCPYCFSHWLSFGAVAVYRLTIIDKVPVMDYVVTAMSMVALSALFLGVIGWAIKTLSSK
jgi:hypothetical protein